MALLFVISSITVGAVVHIFSSDSEVLTPPPKEESSYKLLQKEKKEVGEKFGISPSSGNSTSQVIKLKPGEKININTADILELMRIPGVGKTTATDIRILRNSLGGKFTSWEQLLDVKAISKKKLAELKEYLVLVDE